MNQRIRNYTFVAASKQITLTDVTTINIDEVSAIRNITTNDWIYRLTDTSTDTITIAGNVITFTASNAGMANGDELLIQTDLHFSLDSQTIGGKLSSSFAPDPSEYVTTDHDEVTLDVDGNLKARSLVTTDEGGFRYDFEGSALNFALTGTVDISGTSVVGTGTLFTTELQAYQYIKVTTDATTTWRQISSIISDTELELDIAYPTSPTGASIHMSWVSYDAGTGASIAYNNSIATITAGTTASSITRISRSVDYAPLIGSALVRVSQRIANQTITIGFSERTPTNPKFFARFVLTGVNKIQCAVESCGVKSGIPTTSDIETTNIIYPLGSASNEYCIYKIEVKDQRVKFYINDDLVAEHKKHIPGNYDILGFSTVCINGTTPATSTTIDIDYFNVNNINELSFYQSSENEKLSAGVKAIERSLSVVPAKMRKFRTTFAAAISNNVDAEYFDLIATGSGMTVNQTGGNLVLASGTTARSETTIRSNESFNDTLHMKYQIAMSQRIANHQVFIELVDVVGDNLTYTIASATSITVTIPNNTFTSANVGQSIHIGNFNGTGTFLSGRYPIASVSANDVTFTVSAFAAGTGTCSLFGWNYYQLQYQGVTATQTNFDSQRNGYNSGFTAATINTTASPGHMGMLTAQEDSVMYLDQLVASNTVTPTLPRVSRVTNIPGEDVKLFLQMRLLNLGTSPASGTTTTISFVSVERFQPQQVSLSLIKPQSMQDALPVKPGAATFPVSGTVAATQSGTWSTRTQTGAGGVVTGSFSTTTTPVSLDTSSTISTYIIVSSGPTTTSATSSAYVTNAQAMSICIPVTAVSGTTPTMDVVIEETVDGINFIPVYSFHRITTTGVYHSPLLTFRGRQLRFVQTIGGSSPSFTRSIIANLSSTSPAIYKSAFIRTLDLNQVVTPSAATGDMFDNCTNLTVYMLCTGTTGPSMAMQVSPNNIDWVQVGIWTASIGFTAITVANGYQCKYVRFIPTIAGTSATLTYIQIIGTN